MKISIRIANLQSRILFIFLLQGLLFVGCSSSGGKHILGHRDMQDFQNLRWEHDSSVLVIANNGTFSTNKISLSKGKYTLQIKAEGTPAKNEFPHFVISIGDYLLKDMRIEGEVKTYNMNFELPENTEAPMRFVFDNDYNDSVGDRNIFLHYPIIISRY
ncbi:MAG: carbohydrate-binding domain-containing protein [Chitinophagaceae bacterium]